MFRKYFSVALLLSLYSLPTNAYEHHLNVGIEPKNNAVVSAERWIPILQDLSELMSLSLRFKTAPDVLSFNRSLSNNEYDLIISSSYLNTIFTQKYRLEALAKFKQKGGGDGLVLVGKSQPISQTSSQVITVGISEDNRHSDIQSVLEHIQAENQPFMLVTFKNDSEVIEAIQEGLKHYGIVSLGRNSYVVQSPDFDIYGADEGVETLYLSATPEVSKDTLKNLRNVLVAIEQNPEWQSARGISHVNVISSIEHAFNTYTELHN